MSTNENTFNFDDYIESNFKKESKKEPIIKSEKRYYICPICGQYGTTEDRFPLCYFCKSDNVILLSGAEINDIKQHLSSFPLDELKKYQYFEKAEKYLYDTGWKDDKYNKKILEEGIALREYLRQKYVFNNSKFDKEKYNQRVEYFYQLRLSEDKQARENARRAAEEASRPRCPKCGCTEFQMVPRKWSPLTGFLTNKVDRVCVKCKTRF